MLIVDLATNIARVAQQLQLDVVIDLALEFATRRHLTVPGDIGIGAPASASSASSEPAKQESYTVILWWGPSSASLTVMPMRAQA